MPVTTLDGRMETWAEGIETMEQNLEAIYGPPGITPTLPDVTTEDGLLEAITEEAEKAVLNVAKVNNAYYDTTFNAYKAGIPAGLVKWYGLKKVGGRSIVMNQVVPDGDFSADDNTQYWKTEKTVSSISFADNIATVTLGSTSGFNNPAIRQAVYSAAVSGHTYLLKLSAMADYDMGRVYLRSNTIGNKYLGDITSANQWSNVSVIATASSSGNLIEYLGTSGHSNASEGSKFNVKNIMAVDLTLMFGAGNEPSTVAEFEQIFGAEYYAFNTGTLLSAGVTEVISKDSADAEIATYPIHAEVQALDGYGMSAGSVYNYIDFVNKKFVQNVGSVDMSDLTFGYGPTVGWSATLINVKNPADDDAVFNGVSDNYTAVSRNTQATAFAGGTDAGMVSVSGGKVYVGTGDIGIVPSGTLYYELDEPVETDISSYLTNFGIDVEAGGSLTFPSQNGDDYKIPVPVELEYIAL